MKKAALSLALVLCLTTGPAFAQSTTQYQNITKHAGKIEVTSPPACQNGEVLTYDGKVYTCVKNYLTITCGPGKVIQKIEANGSFTCSDNFIGVKCDNPDEVLQSFDPNAPAPNYGKVCVKPMQATVMPDCGGRPINFNGTSFVCQTTYDVFGNLQVLQMSSYGSGCTKGTLAAHDANFEPHPHAIDDWGAACVTACDRFCRDAAAPQHAGASYAGGTVLGADFYTAHWDCLCIK